MAHTPSEKTLGPGIRIPGDIQLLVPGSVFVTRTEAYLLLRELGEGGTAKAFIAVPICTAEFCGARLNPPPLHQIGIARMLPPESPELDAYERQLPTCVLKVSMIPADHPYAAALLERMQQEALCYGTINDPRLPKLIAASRLPLPYIALERFKGPTWRELLADHHDADPPKRLPWQRALMLIQKLATAVGVLHEHHVVHRDLKPENVVVVRLPGFDELPRVIDLGVAKYVPPAGLEDVLRDVLPPVRSITRHYGGLPVTPGYGSPEQYSPDEPIGPQADVYALGVMAYEAFAGRNPFERSTIAEIIAAMAQPLPLFTHPQLSAETCAELRHVFARATAYRAHERFPDPAAFVQALDHALGRERTSPRAAVVRMPAGESLPSSGARPSHVRATPTPRRTPFPPPQPPHRSGARSALAAVIATAIAITAYALLWERVTLTFRTIAEFVGW